MMHARANFLYMMLWQIQQHHVPTSCSIVQHTLRDLVIVLGFLLIHTTRIHLIHSLYINSEKL